ncbi:MAG: trypsin-like serine protease [Erythrobacter sp.]|uniref:trypsin-like serine protease n=1 Tax=Erythrobacter sp. TaxID=1042 RepID=UPI0025D0E601|nr:trypsin-like serine protease [Erythrobacter sp.]MCL9999309.1 trypsin-like serine protease [Erythrobacter sp.]
MRGKRAMGMAALLALWFGGAPLAAQEPPTPPYAYDGVIDYSSSLMGTKSDAQLAREKAAADAAEAACLEGDAAGCTRLGEAFMNAAGRPFNRPVAELILRRACNAAEARGCYLLAELLLGTTGKAGLPESLEFAIRACRLGSPEGCWRDADNIQNGRFEGLGPGEAMAHRRENCARGLTAVCIDLGDRLASLPGTPEQRIEGRALLGGLCDKGNADACYSLAWALDRYGDGPQDKTRAAALFDRHCRAGHEPSCKTAADDVRDSAGVNDPRFAEYQNLACAAGDAFTCLYLAGVSERSGPEGVPAAIALFDRACPAYEYACTRAAELRAYPALGASCERGAQQACIAQAGWLVEEEGPYRNRPRAAQLYAAACDADVTEACLPAGRLLIEVTANAQADAAAIERYLARGCAASGGEACKALADALAEGTALVQDLPRAAALYADACDTGDPRACKLLADREASDPSIPLTLATDLVPPVLTPEEEAAAAQAAAEQRAREQAEQRARACRGSEVAWEGRIYADEACVNVSASIGGFTINRVEQAPFQALLWRPAVLGRQTVGFRTACGGSVVATGWIITAAHCTYDQGYRIEDHDYRIRLGVIEPEAPEGNTYPIVKVIRHPSYSPKTYQFDVALVQYDPARGTKGDFAFGARRIAVDTRSLAQRPVRPGAPVFAFGWGRQSLDDPTPARILQGVRLELEDAAACTNRTAYRDWRKDSVLCAMGANREQACKGDSGGPLVTYEDQRGVPTLIGVVSSGEKCSTTGVPSRYIRIGHPAVQDWLAKNLPGFRRSAPAAARAR